MHPSLVLGTNLGLVSFVFSLVFSRTQSHNNINTVPFFIYYHFFSFEGEKEHRSPPNLDVT